VAAAAAIGLKKFFSGLAERFVGEAMPVCIGSGNQYPTAKKEGPRNVLRPMSTGRKMPFRCHEIEAISTWHHDLNAVRPRRL